MTLLVALSFIAIGIWCLLWNWRQTQTLAQTRGWQHVQGKILRSEVIAARPQHDEHDSLNLIYTYVVDGQSYTGTRINLFEMETRIGGEALQQLAARLPEKSDVDVYFNPLNPEQAVLLLDERRGRSEGLGMGLLCLTVGLACLLLAVQP